MLPFAARVLTEAQAMAFLRSSPQISTDHILEAAMKVRKGYARSGFYGDLVMAVGWFMLGFFANLATSFLLMDGAQRAGVSTSALVISLILGALGIVLVALGGVLRVRTAN